MAEAARNEQSLASEFAHPLEARRVLDALGARLLGAPLTCQFSGVSVDTRVLAPGSLFVALQGSQRDGHDFLGQAHDLGAAGAVVAARWAEGGESRRGAAIEEARRLPLLVVPDPLTALGDLAATYRRLYPTKLVAITGSNGKTTAKELIACVLAQRYELLKTAGNFNNLLGTPLMILRLNETHEAAVLEIAMNQAGEIARLTEITQPDVAVITNVGPAHLGFFGSLQAVAAAKAELLDGLHRDGVAILNADDPYVEAMAKRAAMRVVSYGTGVAEVRAEAIEDAGLDGVRFKLVLPEAAAHVHLRCLGRHNVEHALAAAAVGREYGLPVEAVVAGLESFTGLPLRLEPVRLRNGATLINDAYNANPASLAAAVRFLAALPRRGRAILIVGDMLELGEDAERLHREAGELCAQAALDGVVALGSFASSLIESAVRSGMPRTACQMATSVEEAAAVLRSSMRPGDVVLCKASRGMRLERVCETLAAEVGTIDAADQDSSPDSSPDSSQDSRRLG